MNLEELLAQYRDAKVELQPALDALKSLEQEIKSHVLETGEVAQIDGASVKIRNGYERVSWDSKGLQGYAVAYPEVNEFKKVSQVGPSAVISVKS